MLELESNILVSVIVPVYNVEQYLERCLQSLVSQTLQEIEIILINDGSPDNSQQIIDRYADAYPEKIRSFSKKNGGLSDARNFGIEKAQGQYLGFVDSDDYIDIDMYEKMVRKALDTESDVVCCSITYEFPQKAQKRYYEKSHFGQSGLESPQALLSANSFAWNKIYRHSFWKKHAFSFPVGQWFEDSAITYEILLYANRIELVNLPFYHYVKEREGSITHSADVRVFDIFLSCNRIVTVFREQSAFDSCENVLKEICMRHLFARYKTIVQSTNKTFARRYVDETFLFLDTHFPNWEKDRWSRMKAQKLWRKKAIALVLSGKFLTKRFVLLSPQRYDFLLRSYRFVTVLWNARTTKFFGKRHLAQRQQRTRVQVQRNGPEILQEVHQILGAIAVPSFADFGTMLGFVRDNEILPHDLDLDIGVIATDPQKDQVRVALERRRFKLWRQYIYQGIVVQESYYYRNVKVDFNYYDMTSDPNAAKTWLFYRQPGVKYSIDERHVVLMSYSPITAFVPAQYTYTVNEKVPIPQIGDTPPSNSNSPCAVDSSCAITYEMIPVEKSVTIMLPENAEQILQEKYGESWRVPDKKWIYWKSPAATLCPNTGRFRVYRHSGPISLEDFDLVDTQE